jgi:hypothetical protein
MFLRNLESRSVTATIGNPASHSHIWHAERRLCVLVDRLVSGVATGQNHQF